MVSKKHITSVIAYDGDALRGGEMDVRDLAPALLAFGDLVRDANRLLNAGRAEVSVRVKSRFRRGSFAVTISLVQTIVQQAKGLFDGGSIYDAFMLAKLLGLAVIAEKPKEVVESIFELLKFLEGTEAKERESVDGGVRITNRRGKMKIVNNGTLILVEDNSIRNDVRRMLAPLRTPGIEKFETRDGGDAVETITLEDLPAVMALPPVSSQPMASVESSVLETRSVDFFQIVSLVFREGNKWKFNAGQGDFWAEIADPVFLAKVHRREILFGEGDVLKAEYVTSSARHGGKIEAETKLLHVFEVIPPGAGWSQEPLPLP
jgi:hypothetical protein